ncbi:hypothetical protein HpHA304_08580 [Helicobacter pylori]
MLFKKKKKKKKKKKRFWGVLETFFNIKRGLNKIKKGMPPIALIKHLVLFKRAIHDFFPIHNVGD